MGFINLERLNIRNKTCELEHSFFLLDVQPPEVYKSHILNGPINELYLFFDISVIKS